MSSARSTRALRGLVAATISTFVALLSHIAGGGAVPGPIGVLVPLVLSMFVCVLLTGRRRSLARLAVAVGASQILFHTLFVLGTAQGITPSTGVNGTSANGHLAHGASVLLDTAAVPPGALVHAGHAGSWMWIAHIGAGLITIAALHRGETILSRLAAVTGLVLARLVPAALAALAVVAGPVRRPAHASRFNVPTLHPLGVHPSTSALRGPPALSGI